MPVKKILLTVGVVFGVVYFTLLHTVLPILLLTGLLGGFGLDLFEVSGSLESGIHVASISSRNGGFFVRNVDFKFNGLTNLYWTRELRISKISFDELRFIENSTGKANNVERKERPGKGPEKNKTLAKNEDWLKLITVDELHFAKIHIKLADYKTPLIIDDLKVLDFNSKKSNIIKTFVLSSNFGSLLLEPLPNEGIRIAAIARANLNEDLLKDIDFSGTLRIKNQRLEEFQMAGLDGKFNSQLQGDDLTIKLHDLDFSKFFKGELPISKMNGEVFWGDFQHLSFSQIRSTNLSVNVGATNFAFQDGLLVHVDADDLEDALYLKANHSPNLVLNFAILKDFNSDRDGGKKKFLKVSLVSNPPQEKAKLLARTYFQTELTDLSEEQRRAVHSLIPFFH